MSSDPPIAGPGPGSLAHSHKPAPRVTLATPISPTITFIASWRGQLLICIVSLALGAVYFLVRDPLRHWTRRRKERLSQARMEELMSMEKEKEAHKGSTEAESVESKEKRGRKKRRGQAGLLKVPALDGSSSVDGSPVPPSSTSSSPVPRRRASTNNSTRPRGSSLASLPEAVESSFTSSTSRVENKPDKSIAPMDQPTLVPPSLVVRPTTPPLPWEVPLPDSPIAGPSRSAPSITSSDVASLDGDTSESTSTRPASSTVSNGGFSIIPEVGYLPPSALQSSKKKKRKGGSAVPAPSENLDSSASASPMINGMASPFTGFASGSAMKLPSTPRTPSSSRHARKASLTRPIGADLEDLLTEREKMIDALRADIGTAKAEEAKAIEELSRTKAESECMGAELEGMKRMGSMSDHDGRRREAELSARLSQISSQYTATLHRLGALENFVRESGLQPPSTLPTVPNCTFLPPYSAQQLSPPSPFGMSFASPHTPSHTMGYIPYPSPGMYPSPMLHPNFHPQQLHSPRAVSPGSYRRASTAGGEDTAALAGAILPGAYGYHAALFPSVNHLPGQPLPKVNGHANGTGTNAADKRRISIESSVMKRKPDHPGSSSRSDAGSSQGSSQRDEPIPEGEEDTISANGVAGLGVGDIPRPRMGSPGNGTLSPQSTDDPSSPSHPSSPSPLNRGAVLLTPASADLFQRLHENGHLEAGPIRSAASMSSNSGSSTDLTGLTGIKMIAEGEKGNVYYSTLAPVPSMESLEESATYTNGTASEIDTNGMENDHGAKREEFMPMFASLAHTPAQLAEIQRMREEALRNTKTKDNGVNGVNGANGIHGPNGVGH